MENEEDLNENIEETIDDSEPMLNEQLIERLENFTPGLQNVENMTFRSSETSSGLIHEQGSLLEPNSSVRIKSESILQADANYNQQETQPLPTTSRIAGMGVSESDIGTRICGSPEKLRNYGLLYRDVCDQSDSISRSSSEESSNLNVYIINQDDWTTTKRLKHQLYSNNNKEDVRMKKMSHATSTAKESTTQCPEKAVKDRKITSETHKGIQSSSSQEQSTSNNGSSASDIAGSASDIAGSASDIAGSASDIAGSSLEQVSGCLQSISLLERLPTHVIDDTVESLNDSIQSELTTQRHGSSSGSGISTTKPKITVKKLDLPDTNIADSALQSKDTNPNTLTVPTSDPSNPSSPRRKISPRKVFSPKRLSPKVRMASSDSDSSCDNAQQAKGLKRKKHRMKKKHIKFRSSDTSLCKSNSEICEDADPDADADADLDDSSLTDRETKKFKRYSFSKLETRFNPTRETSDSSENAKTSEPNVEIKRRSRKRPLSAPQFTEKEESDSEYEKKKFKPNKSTDE